VAVDVGEGRFYVKIKAIKSQPLVENIEIFDIRFNSIFIFF